MNKGGLISKKYSQSGPILIKRSLESLSFNFSIQSKILGETLMTLEHATPASAASNAQNK